MSKEYKIDMRNFRPGPRWKADPLPTDKTSMAEIADKIAAWEDKIWNQVEEPQWIFTVEQAKQVSKLRAEGKKLAIPDSVLDRVDEIAKADTNLESIKEELTQSLKARNKLRKDVDRSREVGGL